jgi:hypothetical protein
MTIQTTETKKAEGFASTPIQTVTPSGLPSAEHIAPYAAPRTPFQMGPVEETATAAQTQATRNTVQTPTVGGRSLMVLVAEWFVGVALVYTGMQWCKHNIPGFTGGPGFTSLIVMGVLTGLALQSARAVVKTVRGWIGTRSTD